MPFVQRNWKGEITGVFANSQSGYAEEELNEDHPDLITFHEANPPPPGWPPPPMTQAEIRESQQTHDRLRAENIELSNAI
jgi:hypothetical protein